MWRRLQSAVMPEAVRSLLERLREDETQAASVRERLLELEPEAVVPPLRSVLQGGDAKWKAVVLSRVVAEMPEDMVLELGPDLLFLALNPSVADQDEGVDELAEELLNRMFHQ